MNPKIRNALKMGIPPLVLIIVMTTLMLLRPSLFVNLGIALFCATIASFAANRMLGR